MGAPVKFEAWSKPGASGTANQANVLVQKAHRETTATEYAMRGYYVVMHGMGVVGSLALMVLAGWVVQVVVKRLSGAQPASVQMDYVVQMYPPCILCILATGAAAIEVINLKASTQHFERQFFVPATSASGSARCVVQTGTFISVDLLNSINKEAQISGAGKKLDVEGFKKTRDIQTASAQYDTLVADCARGVDTVIAALTPVQGTSTDPSTTVGAIKASFAAMVEAEASLYKECKLIKIGRAQLRWLQNNPHTIGVKAAYDTLVGVTRPPSTITDQALQEAARGLASKLEGTELYSLLDPGSNLEMTPDQYGRLLQGGAIADKGEDYLDKVAQHETDITGLNVYLGSARLDSIGGRYAAKAVEAGFVDSPPRLVQSIQLLTQATSADDKTPKGYTIAVFKNKSDTEQQDTVVMVKVTAALVNQVKGVDKKHRNTQAARSVVIEVTLWLAAALTAVRYGLQVLADTVVTKQPSANCTRMVALRNNMDEENLQARLGETRNYKLRADYANCQMQTTLVDTRDKLALAVKYALLILVFCLLGAAMRSHFHDLGIERGRDAADLNTMYEQLQLIHGALTGSADDMDKLDTALDELSNARDRCKMLRTFSASAGKSPVLGRVAKYALASAFALIALLVAWQSMQPGMQMQRLRELRAISGGGLPELRAISGGGTTRPELELELERLHAEGSPLEMQVVSLCVLLVASAYACFALGTEVVGSAFPQ
jgi:hypothetical protein